MPRVNTVKKCLKDQGQCGKCDTPILKGDPYVWWKFRYGGRRVRCTKPDCYPKPSDLTQSEFLSQMYDFQERIANIGENIENATEDLAGERDMLVDEIRTLGEEQEEKKSNMPEGLQEGSTGELLEERYNNCEEWASELENVDLEGENLPNPQALRACELFLR